MCERYKANDPIVGLLGEPSGRFDYYVIYCDYPSKPTAEVSSCSPPPPPKKLQPLDPYYQKAIKYLSKPKNNPPVIKPVILEPLPCYMFSPDAPDYSSKFFKPDKFEDLNQRTKYR